MVSLVGNAKQESFKRFLMSCLSRINALPVVDCSMHDVLWLRSCDHQTSCACAAQVEVRLKQIAEHSSTRQIPWADRSLRCTVMSVCELPCMTVDTVSDSLWNTQPVQLASDEWSFMIILSATIDELHCRVHHSLKFVLD